MSIFDQQAEPSNRPSDVQAVERYRYLMRTAPPDDLERAHEEAFRQMTPGQRQLALQALSGQLPEAERRQLTEEPRSLARAATRTELRRPGALERTFGGGMFGNLFSSLAGAFIGSSIAHSLFGGLGEEPGANPGTDEVASSDEDVDSGDDAGDDFDGDFGSDV
jgi:hypothetical protein